MTGQDSVFKPQGTQPSAPASYSAAPEPKSFTLTPSPEQNRAALTGSSSSGSASSAPSAPALSTAGTVPGGTQASDPYGVSAAYNTYLQSLQDSPEVTRTQRQINAIQSSKEAGLQGTEERTIPMAFITGQQAAIEKRAAIQQTPLLQRLALAQQAQQAQQQQALAAYNAALKEREYNAGLSQPVTLSAGARLVDPMTGRVIASAPSASASTGGVGDQWNLTPAQEQKLLTITNNLQKNAVYAQGQQADYLRSVADAVIANPGNAGTQLMGLYTLVKSLDPQSAVREGELDLAQRTQSYLGQFGTALARISEGKILDPNSAVQLAQSTRQLADMWAQAGSRIKTQYEAQAKTIGLGEPFAYYMSQTYSPNTNQSSGVTVQLPDGTMATFPNQQAANSALAEINGAGASTTAAPSAQQGSGGGFWDAVKGSIGLGGLGKNLFPFF